MTTSGQPVPGLAERMTVAGVTQAELARRVGVSRETLRRIAAGGSTTPGTARRIADALGDASIRAADAEAIVRAIAAGASPIDAHYTACRFCGVDADAEHEVDCPWRLSVEWVDRHPQRRASYRFPGGPG